MYLLKETNYLIAKPGFKGVTDNMPMLLVRLNYKLLWAKGQIAGEKK